MKHFSILFLITFFIYACKNEKPPRNFENLKITAFKKDSTYIRAIEAVNKNELIYAGSKGDIGITKNGGKTWNTKYLKYNDSIIPHFRSIATNKAGVFALSIENPALLYHIMPTKETIVYTEKHEKVFYNSMKFFADGKHGIAVGDPIEDCPSIILTTNGGKKWAKLPCSQLPKLKKGEAFFAASNTNIAVYNKTVWIATGGSEARILKSEDYGNTWTIYNTPIIHGSGPQGIYSIDFYDELRGIAFGGNYLLPNDNCANKAITNDGGKTWKLVADNQNPNFKSCVQYVPNANGKEIFAVGKTGISFSNDSGHTWKKVTNEPYYAIQFADKNTAWLSGPQKIGKLVLN